MINISLTGDQIDGVVVQELKLTLELLLKLDTDEGGNYLDPDLTLINAVKVTLQYFMPQNEVTEYLEDIYIKESTMFAQLLGVTDDVK